MNATAQPALSPTQPWEHSYAKDLEGLYLPWQPARTPEPHMVVWNGLLAAELGLGQLDADRAVKLFSGNELPANAKPIAQAYAGHQFGGWSPRLGDGRALLLGEVHDITGALRDIAFKGSGRTPFSRGGDGKAALGPMLREYVMGEAMHALRIPTTRALAVVATGERVIRDNGPLPGAVLTRVAASHLRVGTFQYAAAQDDVDVLKRLLAYTVARHDRGLSQLPCDQQALGLLKALADRQARLIAQWMGVGFIHGVMNTDNMAISGETIDYGPCAFMDRYDPAAVFSSIDYHGRYAYGNQAPIARWNLARLAESLLPLLHPQPEQAVAAATNIIDAFPALYQQHWTRVMRAKLGLSDERPQDHSLATAFLASMQGQGVDFTLAFHHLGHAAASGDFSALRALYADPSMLNAWIPQWLQRLPGAGPSVATALRMQAANPWVIPRNHVVQAALDAASDRGDLQPVQELMNWLQRPFDAPEQTSGLDLYTHPAAAAQSACFQTFCGT